MSDSPVAILFDSDGNPIGTALDNGIYRLLVESKTQIPSQATRSYVNASTSDTLILNSNSNRIKVIIYNESDSPLHIGYGSDPVGLLDFTLIISSQSEKELPIFTGEIRGIWQAEGGTAYITEMT